MTLTLTKSAAVICIGKGSGLSIADVKPNLIIANSKVCHLIAAVGGWIVQVKAVAARSAGQNIIAGSACDRIVVIAAV